MSLNDSIHHLKNVELFQLLGPEALRLIAFSADSRILQAGDVLFREGEVADAGIVVLSGEIGLSRADQPDQPPQKVGPGALIGEMAMLTATHRPATAVAREISSILRISRNLFHRVLEEYPDCAVRLHTGIAQRTQGTMASLQDYSRRFLEGQGKLQP